MIKKPFNIIAKIPVLIAFLIVITTGCHTPEEISPQKPLEEETLLPEIPQLLQDKGSVVSDKNNVLSRTDDANTVGELGSSVIVIKTPFKPSLKIPKPRCKNC